MMQELFQQPNKLILQLFFLYETVFFLYES